MIIGMDTARNKLLLTFFNYAAIYIVWGTTYFFIARAVETIPTLWLLGIRWTAAGLFLVLPVLLKSEGRAGLTVRQVVFSCLLGALLILGGNGLVSHALKKLPSYLAALIVALVPLFVAVFSFFIRRERFTVHKTIAIVMGIAGLVFLAYNGGNSAFTLPWQTWLALVAIISWSLGTALGASLTLPANPFLSAGIQMLFAGIVSLILALVFSRPAGEMVRGISTTSFWSLLYLVLIGSGAFVSYIWLLRHEPAFRVSSNTLVNPVIAAVIGLLIGGELTRPYLGIGMPLILGGVFLMLYVKKEGRAEVK